MTQAFHPQALHRCARHGLSPDQALINQFVVTPADAGDIDGLTPVRVTKWTLHHGKAVPIMPLRDAKDRLFGLFVGVGVDGDGRLVCPDCFARLNSKSAGFEKAFEDYVGRIAGRFVILLDSGAKTRLYFDPMAQLATFYNPETRRAGSNVFLVTETLSDPNPLIGPACDGPDTAARALPLGHTLDSATRLVPGNHRLDLKNFSLARVWPLRNTIRKVTKAAAGPVLEKIAARQRAIVTALILGRDCVMPISADPGARLLLAAAGQSRDEIPQYFCVQDTDEDSAAAADAAASIASALDLPFQRHDRETANRFDQSRQARRQRKRQFWLRTSCAFRANRIVAANIDGLQWKHHLVLDPGGAEVLTAAPAKPSAKAAMALLLADADADKDVTSALKPEYDTWKAGLPKSLHSKVLDFIRMEWHRPAAAVQYYAMQDNFAVPPFSDRTTLELALKLPDDLRRGPGLVDGVIAAADIRVSGLDGTDLALARAS